MGHLTPTVWDVIFKRDTGNRGFTDTSAATLREFVTETEWVMSGKIIAVDFFHTSSLMETIIKYVELSLLGISTS